jgi:hypothetical protein
MKGTKEDIFLFLEVSIYQILLYGKANEVVLDTCKKLKIAQENLF